MDSKSWVELMKRSCVEKSCRGVDRGVVEELVEELSRS